MNTPLYDALLALSQDDTLRFHMPGHKGTAIGSIYDDVFSIDYTEIPSTGNLYLEGDHIISQAEGLMADYYGGGGCVFLTCGATQGIKAMLATFSKGGTVLLDRNTHRSVTDGCALLGLKTVYIQPDYLPVLGITAQHDLARVENILEQNPEITCFLVTSPTYYGYCLDIAAIKAVCKSHGVSLLVDSAHGSHLRACGVLDPVAQGADAVVFSPHKTLFALTQGAYIIIGDKMQTPNVRVQAQLFGTSSPSYPIMASLDLSRGIVEALDPRSVCRLISGVNYSRLRLEELGFSCPMLGDPLRLTVNCSRLMVNPFDLAHFARLDSVEVEMCDTYNLVLIVTFADTPDKLFKMVDVLQNALMLCTRVTTPCCSLAPPLPIAELDIRQALLAPRATAPLCQCAGRISAESIYIYPPGVPIILPGEIIDQKSLEYLADIRYNMNKEIHFVK